MQVTIYLSDGGELHWEDFDPETALDLRDELDREGNILTFDMDGTTVLVNQAHVVRIDIEQESDSPSPEPERD